jgi:hypothetical protein
MALAGRDGLSFQVWLMKQASKIQNLQLVAASTVNGEVFEGGEIGV